MTTVIPNTISVHTPGPWKWFNYPDGRRLLCGKDGAVIYAPDAPMTIDDADARLIAAAPDLLAAARAVLAQFTAGMFVRNSDGDFGDDWAMKAVGPLRDLAALKSAVDLVDGVSCRTEDFTE